jgi:iron(III) transport system ATP-binding protein
MTELGVSDVSVRLGGHDILRGVSFRVSPGTVVALLGPSGSGKTTLLRAVAGLETPHAGTIRLGETVFFDAGKGVELPAEKRGLGLVFQSYALWPHCTVFDNVAYGLKLRGANPDNAREQVERVLAQIGLSKLAARYPHQLSGGQQQRVALARALVYRPAVILLDEPLSNLDSKLREEARAWLRRLIAELNLSALYVTHDQVEAMAIADRVVLLNHGMIEQQGAPADLYNAPASLFVAEFMGSNNRVEGTLIERNGSTAVMEISGHRLQGMARSAAPPGSAATGVIRLERMQVAEGGGPNRIPMTLATQMYLGDRWELVFMQNDFTVRAYAPAALGKGVCHLEFPPDALWIF